MRSIACRLHLVPRRWAPRADAPLWHVPAGPPFGCAHVRGLASAVSVSASLVKELRDRTGASMGKCRDALKEEGGDVEKAVLWLRQRGIKSMERRTAEAAEALLAVSASPSAAAIVELRAETDFVTRGQLFGQLSISLAATAAGSTGPLAEAPLRGGPDRPEQVSPDATAGAALLELGSVLGERLELGAVHALTAVPHGAVGGYVHPKGADSQPGTGRMAALVSLRCSGPCDAERLGAIATQLARHVVASQPRFVSITSVPDDVLKKERETMRAAHLESLAPSRKAGTIDENVMAKVLDGKTKRFYSETVLMCQEFLAPGQGKDQKPAPVADWLQGEAKALGVEKVLVEDFRLAIL